MPKSMLELREQLSAIEPEERTYEGIGPSEIDLLLRLMDDEEDWMAARAVHALSRIDADQARQAVVRAAESPRTEVRLAAATSAARVPARISDEILTRLLDDSQPAVRKFAIKSVSGRNNEALRRRLSDIADSEADARLRRVAQQQARSVGQS